MELNKEHYRSYVYIEMKRGKTAAEIYQQLQEADIPESPSQATVYRWYKKFHEGHVHLVDEPRGGRPCSSTTSSNILLIEQILRKEPRQSLRMVAEEVNISKDTVRNIVKERLGLRKVCSVWVPHTLTDENKQQRVNCAKHFLSLMENYSSADLLQRWATEDESWVPFHGLPTKQEHKAWLSKNEPKLRVLKPTLTSKKAMIIMAFTGCRNFHVEVLSHGETLTCQRYISFIHSVGERWRVLRSVPTKLSLLLWQHDNAAPHKALATEEFLQQRQMQLIPQAAYSPDLNQCDRWLFADLKKHLRQMEFTNAEEIREESLRFLRSIPKDRFIKELENLRHHCIAVVKQKGDYVV